MTIECSARLSITDHTVAGSAFGYILLRAAGKSSKCKISIRDQPRIREVTTSYRKILVLVTEAAFDAVGGDSMNTPKPSVPFIVSADAKLITFLLSNPAPVRASSGSVLIYLRSKAMQTMQAMAWPIPANFTQPDNPMAPS